MSQDTFARIMGLAAVVFLIYALVLGLEAVLGRELLPGPGVYDREVSGNIRPIEVSTDVERRADRGAPDHRRERPARQPARTKPAGGDGGTDAGTLAEVASASVEAGVADGLPSVDTLLPSGLEAPKAVTRLSDQPLAVLDE